MTMERQNLLYDVAHVREIPLKGNLGYQLPDNRVALINYNVGGKLLPLFIVNLENGSIESREIKTETNHRTIFGLLSSNLPGLFVYDDGFYAPVIETKILNKTLDKIESAIPKNLTAGIKVDNKHLMALRDGTIVIINLDDSGYYKYLFQTNNEWNIFRSNKFGYLIKISDNEYAAATYQNHSNIICFKLDNNLSPVRLNICSEPKDPSSGDLASKEHTTIRSICSLNNSTFASLQVTNHNKPEKKPSCTVTVWNSLGKCLRTIEIPELINKLITCPDNKTLIGYGNFDKDYRAAPDFIYLIDSECGHIQTIPVPSDVNSLMVNKDGNMLIELKDKILQMKLTPKPALRVPDHLSFLPSKVHDNNEKQQPSRSFQLGMK